MEQERKDTIIREIKYWKQHKLLPDQYCDFLLTLYTEGEQKNDPEFRKTPLSSLKAIYALIAVHLLLLIVVVVIYFTDFSLVMQILIGIFCAICMGFIATKFVKHHQKFAHFFYLITAITVFLLMVHMSVTFFPNHRMPVGSVVIANCLIWLFIGYKWKIKYFLVAGIGGSFLFGVFLLSNI